jgi:hypothetical protein
VKSSAAAFAALSPPFCSDQFTRRPCGNGLRSSTAVAGSRQRWRADQLLAQIDDPVAKAAFHLRHVGDAEPQQLRMQTKKVTR